LEEQVQWPFKTTPTPQRGNGRCFSPACVCVVCVLLRINNAFCVAAASRLYAKRYRAAHNRWICASRKLHSKKITYRERHILLVRELIAKVGFNEQYTIQRFLGAYVEFIH
jgi:hypothetical protein